MISCDMQLCYPPHHDRFANEHRIFIGCHQFVSFIQFLCGYALKLCPTYSYDLCTKLKSIINRTFVLNRKNFLKKWTFVLNWKKLLIGPLYQIGKIFLKKLTFALNWKFLDQVEKYRMNHQMIAKRSNLLRIPFICIVNKTCKYYEIH